MGRWKTFRCACEFAKSVDDPNPYHYPRVGIADNVLYQGHWIIRHSVTGEEATIWRPGEPALHAECAPCCMSYFDKSAKPDAPSNDGRAA